MALKEFDDTSPRTRDKNWKDDISVAELPKMDEWYRFRIVGGVFSYAQHWIEFTNKTGEKKRYPIDCANWDPNTERTSKAGGCPACEAGISCSARYMVNAIDRQLQDRGEEDSIVALDLPPTVMTQLIKLKDLNVVKGEAKSIVHPKFGCDVHLSKQRSKKRGGTEWQAQKGDRAPLSEEEAGLQLIDFEQFYVEPDVHKIRADLKRHGYFADEKPSGSKSSKKIDDDEDDVVPPKKPSSAKKPAASSDDEDEGDAPPPRTQTKKPAKAPPPDDEEEDEEDAPPPRAQSKKPAKAPPPDEDDFADDYENI